MPHLSLNDLIVENGKLFFTKYIAERFTTDFLSYTFSVVTFNYDHAFYLVHLIHASARSDIIESYRGPDNPTLIRVISFESDVGIVFILLKNGAKFLIESVLLLLFNLKLLHTSTVFTRIKVSITIIIISLTLISPL